MHRNWNNNVKVKHLTLVLYDVNEYDKMHQPVWLILLWSDWHLFRVALSDLAVNIDWLLSWKNKWLFLCFNFSEEKVSVGCAASLYDHLPLIDNHCFILFSYNFESSLACTLCRHVYIYNKVSHNITHLHFLHYL